MKVRTIGKFIFLLIALLLLDAQLFSSHYEQIQEELIRVIDSKDVKDFLKSLEGGSQELAQADGGKLSEESNRPEASKEETQPQRIDEQKEDFEALDKVLESQGSKYYDAGKYSQAYKKLIRAFKEDPCNEKVSDALKKIAAQWELSKSKRKKALHIYLHLLECDPNNPDLLFKAARLLAWNRKIKSAEKTLVKLLAVSPNNNDGVRFLFNLYVNQRQWAKAESLLKQYPRHPEEKELRARLALRRRQLSSAQEQYEELVALLPGNIDYRRALARSLAGQRKFTEAKSQYKTLIEQEPKNHLNWVEMMEVKSHTNVSMKGDGRYIKGKQSDPDLQAPVVTDFYTIANYTIDIPILDRWKIQLIDRFHHEKEMDIFIPLGMNYNAYVYGAQLNSHVLIGRHFRWEVVMRFLGARGYNNNAIFPFQSTARFQPGTAFVYSTPLMYASLSSRVETFIMKDFQKIQSELMRTINLHAVYIIRPRAYLNPAFEVSFEEKFYDDAIKNYENILYLWGKFDLFTRYLRFVYGFRQANFKQPTENYDSYKLQIRNIIGGVCAFNITSRFNFECNYLHWWKYSAVLSQPIGLFIFEANKQWIQADKVEMKATYQLRDYLRLQAHGHLLYTTLTYKSYEVGGSIEWQF